MEAELLKELLEKMKGHDDLDFYLGLMPELKDWLDKQEES